VSRTRESTVTTLDEYQQAATFRAALARFSRRVDATCRRHGLTTDQYTLLAMIKGAPAGTEHATATELADRLHLSLNGVTERLQRAESDGLIRRKRSHEDRRVYHVRLTAAAERRFERAFRELQSDGELIANLREALDAFVTEQLVASTSHDQSFRATHAR
jgi:DNA-binding MarR family transcriptional regulator